MCIEVRMLLFTIISCFHAVPPSYDQGYPPPAQGYAQPPPPQQGPNVVVVQGGGGQTVQQTTIIQAEKQKVNHVLHLLITLFLFPPWLIVWIILCCIYGC